MSKQNKVSQNKRHRIETAAKYLNRFEKYVETGYTTFMEIQIIEALQGLYSEFLLFMTTFVSFLASWIGFGFILITLLLFCKFRYALTFAVTSGVVSAVVNIIKIIVQRPRPWMESETILNLLEASGYSMPSGHTATASVIAVFLAYWIFKSIKNKPLKISLISLCGVYVACTMFSRMFLGQHFLSDVCAGFAVGGGIAVGAIFLYEKVIKNMVFKKRRK